MIGKKNFKGGLELKFFQRDRPESLKGLSVKKYGLAVGRNVLRFLMMGQPLSSNLLFSWSIFRAVFIERDPVLLRGMRLAFQQGFINLFHQLRECTLTPEQEEQVQLYLSNCMSLLPYADLTPYESIKIPQYINQQWVLIDYQVCPIELTPTTGAQRFFLQDYDRVFAYGLEPIYQPEAEPHLIFMGTTYPAGQGFISQLDADFNASGSVGESLYRHSRELIKQWIGRQNKKVHACGVSLGGALSLLLAIDQGDSLSRVDALNAPGLQESNPADSTIDHWNNLSCKPKVVVQRQAHDQVSALGTWKNEWEIVKVVPPKHKEGGSSFFDHFLNYAGFADTQFIYGAPTLDNEKRKWRNFWLFFLGRGVLHHTLILPYKYLARPFLTFFYQQLAYNKVIKVTLVLSLITLVVAFAFSLPLTYVVGAVLGALTLSFGVALCLKAWHLLSKQSSPLAHLHDPKLPRNKVMDIYDIENAIDMDVSYQELRTYYQVMRSLVKQKELVPAEDKPMKHHNILSKRQLLTMDEVSLAQQPPLKLHLTKAKAAHIKHTLTLVSKIGLENRDQLKVRVTEEYERYRTGKHSKDENRAHKPGASFNRHRFYGTTNQSKASVATQNEPPTVSCLSALGGVI